MPRAKKRGRQPRRGWGAVRHLPSGRYQASYVGPDVRRHIAPFTFDAKMDAEAWLAAERRLVVMDEWTPPKIRNRRHRAEGVTLAEWAPLAIERRRVRGEPLRPGTKELYGKLLRTAILPELGDYTLKAVTAEVVELWYDDLDTAKPTRRAHAYSLLRMVMEQAIRDGRHPGPNPCQVVGAGSTKRARKIRIAEPVEIVRIAQGMPEHLRLLVLIAGWCGLRYGELAELRRLDLDTERGTVSVSRAVVRVDGKNIIGPPKSEAGVRVVHMPPHLVPAVVEHLAEHVEDSADALVFRGHDGDHLSHGEAMRTFGAAREAAGRPDLRLHDLRHTAATMAAQKGATLAELMARIGHSTSAAALKYQHAAGGRDAEIARRLSELAEPE